MAYYNQEMKRAAAPKIKALLKEYDLKGSLSVRHHMSVVLTITSGPIDFDLDRGYAQVNVYWLREHYTGKALEFLEKAYEILMQGNHNNSDIQSDYFDVGWYVDINVGRWDKPYVCTEKVQETV